MRILILFLLVSCDSSETPMPDDHCDTADQMACGEASGGTTVALLCMPNGTWSYVTNCNSCDHVSGCKSEVICNGINVANEGLHCDVQGVGACDVNNNRHLLKCETDNTWTLLFDCTTTGMVCGKGPDGNLTCI
jgi:hypothetical protein